MTRLIAAIAFLSAFTILLCQAAPFHGEPRAASSASVTTSAAPVPSANAPSTSPSSTSTSPLPSASANATASPPINWAAYGNGTMGSALHQLLLRIGPDAPQRWVTAPGGIASTQIGAADPAGSNKDLLAAADTLDFPDAARQAGTSWTDTYIKFLIEAGGHANSTDNTELEAAQNATTKAYAAAERKLVRAYEAAHADNITYVGMDVMGVPQINATTMGEMIGWAWRGGDANCTANSTSASGGSAANCTFDSDGAYTAKDYQSYANASSAYQSMQTREAGYNNLTQMMLQGYKLKQTWPELSIFNLTMDVGEGTQFGPAWSATITGFAMKATVGAGVEILESNLEDGPGQSTDNSTDSSVLGMSKRTENAARGLSALQAFAHHMNTSKSDNTRVMMAAAAVTNSDPLNQPMSADQSFVLLNLQEGSWADKRDEFIIAGRQMTLDVVEKYFGPGASGSGPIGRRWTHLMLLASFGQANGTASVGMVQLFGKVYGVVPGLV